jgi:response regulator RpfG family c-di-GMP phosphodiesterase
VLHDIGKIAVPDSVLTKAGKLTEREFDLIRRHPDVGAAILEHISLMRIEARLVRFHHEAWDGRGYPTGLGGRRIPLGSRIINIADSIDAMLMHRTYKQAYSIDRMLAELTRCAGGQFDPELIPPAVRWCRDNRSRLILPVRVAEAESA